MNKKSPHFFSLQNILCLGSIATLFFKIYFAHIDSFFITLLAILFLAISVSNSVHSAEVIAKKLGPSLGTLILALAVTIIEVGLILSLMSNNSESSHTIARDTVFSAIMIVSNGIIGVCLLLGGLKHHELGFSPQGTSSLLAVLTVLSSLTLILPNYTTSTLGPTYSQGQLVFASCASIFLYICLVWAQTKSQKSYFEAPSSSPKNQNHGDSYIPTNLQTWISFITLVLSLGAVIGLAKSLSPAIEAGIHYLGAPTSFVGVIIAILVLAPEALAAISAARQNQLQTSLNLALGSGAASIALTIPAVSAYSIFSKQPLTLGLDTKGTAFLVLTFILGGMTLGTGRTTSLQGLVHLVIMGAYIVLSLIP